MKRSRTFEVAYNYFEPGTYVTPTSERHPLERGKVYKVTACLEPRFADEGCSCFVDDRKTGVTTEYLREATDIEVESGVVTFFDDDALVRVGHYNITLINVPCECGWHLRFTQLQDLHAKLGDAINEIKSKTKVAE